MIHLKYFYAWFEVRDSHFLFCHMITKLSHLLVEKTIISPLPCLVCHESKVSILVESMPGFSNLFSFSYLYTD